MDPELKTQMSELLTITRENNKILRKMRRAAIWSGIGRMIWWGLVIASSAAAYIYLQPVLQVFLDSYGQVMKVTGTLEKAGTGLQQNLQNFLK